MSNKILGTATNKLQITQTNLATIHILFIFRKKIGTNFIFISNEFAMSFTE